MMVSSVKTLPFQHQPEPTSRTILSQPGIAFPLADCRALRIEGLLLRVSTLSKSRSRVLRREQPSLISRSWLIRLRSSAGIGTEGDGCLYPP
jgi:hypothetical protein